MPLARAFAEAGHEVAFTTSPYFEEHVEAAGFSFLPAGIDHAERWARFEPFQAEHLALPLEERRAFLFPHMFGTIEAPAKIDELRELVRAWQPDLIVHDSADLAAPVAAEEAGIPSVNHSFGRLVPVDVVAAAASAAGLSADPLGGMFRGIYVDIAPPSFQTEALPPGPGSSACGRFRSSRLRRNERPSGSTGFPTGRPSTSRSGRSSTISRCSACCWTRSPTSTAT